MLRRLSTCNHVMKCTEDAAFRVGVNGVSAYQSQLGLLLVENRSKVQRNIGLFIQYH